MKYSKYVRTGETMEYSNFLFPSHQREINNKTIDKVMASIKEHGVISAISVRESKENIGNYDVFNGQHTLLACKLLEAPVVYNVFREVTNKSMIALNNSGKDWTLKDYLQFGVQDKIKSYIFLNTTHKSEGLPLTALTMMYGGRYENVKFKSLTWKAATIKRGDEILSYVNDFEKSFNIKHSRHARFIWGLGKVVDTGKYDHSRMMSQLAKCSQMLTKQANPEDYAQNIEMVYNYGLTDKNKVRFTKK